MAHAMFRTMKTRSHSRSASSNVTSVSVTKYPTSYLRLLICQQKYHSLARVVWCRQGEIKEILYIITRILFRGVCVAERGCMARGHAWWGGGMCDRGTCVAVRGGLSGRGCVWHTVNDRAVRILLECILVIY